jgi:hypothetical protein
VRPDGWLLLAARAGAIFGFPISAVLVSAAGLEAAQSALRFRCLLRRRCIRVCRARLSLRYGCNVLVFSHQQRSKHMTTFRVTLKRVVYAEVTVDADNAKAVRELLDENSSDAVLDYFRDSMIHSDSITVTKVHKLEAA